MLTDLDIAAAILYKAGATPPYSKGSALAMVEVGASLGRQEERAAVLAELRKWLEKLDAPDTWVSVDEILAQLERMDASETR